jgi:phosphoribosyl 1,2-cyclic phosphate phosphodiesterase
VNIRFLGTSAAEGVPALFCSCDTCRYSREHGGRNVRTRSQALIDGALLIDMGPDALMHTLNLGLDFTRIEHCLITHVHEDHLLRHNFEMRQRGFANLTPDIGPLHVYGSEELYESMVSDTDNGGRVNRDDSVLCHVLEPLTPTVIGGYEVVALPAHHGTRQPYNYIIRSMTEDKALLYAHDTCLWTDERVWSYFEQAKPHLDLVSMDCTWGNQNRTALSHHMSLGQNVQMKDRLLSLGVCDADTVFISNHFSHNGKDAAYDVFSPIAKEQGILTSYDGMSIEF